MSGIRTPVRKMETANEDGHDAASKTDDKDLTDNGRNCWVCLEEDHAFVGRQAWVRPCLCRGTSKWVHQVCLQRWIDEKQHGNTLSPVSCSQCNAIYLIVFPKPGYVMYCFDLIEGTIQKVCPFVAFGMLIGTVYWTAVSYGSFTLIQVFGRDEAMKLMDEGGPLFLLVSLPTIPIMLMVGKLINWDDYILQFWVRHLAVSRPRLMQATSNQMSESQEVTPTHSHLVFADPPPNIFRVVCGALMFPTVASIVGGLLFKKVTSLFQRTMLGGLTFIVVKGVFKTCYKRNLLIRRMKRKIIDYEDGRQAGENT